MSEKYYTIISNQDHIICQILDDDNVLELKKDDGDEYIASIKTNYVIAKKVLSLTYTPDGQNVMLIPYEKSVFGASHVTFNTNQISKIQFVKDSLEKQAMAANSGLVSI